MKPIAVDLPYPTIDNVKEDRKSASIISPAYAGLHSELTATLQYIYHYVYFKKYDDEQTAKTVMGIAVTEMQHLDILGELFLKLGVDPVYTAYPPFNREYFSTASVSYSKTPVKMLLDDISGELYAVKQYKKMVERLDNEEVEAVIKRIILDEELHVLVLKERLKTYGEYGGIVTD